MNSHAHVMHYFMKSSKSCQRILPANAAIADEHGKMF